MTETNRYTIISCIVCSGDQATPPRGALEGVKVELCAKHRAESLAERPSATEVRKYTEDSPIIQQGSGILAAHASRLNETPIIRLGTQLFISNASAVANSDIVVVGSKLIMEDVEKLKHGARRMIHAGAKRICKATADSAGEEVNDGIMGEVDSDDESCVLVL